MSFLLRVAAVASVLGMALAAPALAAEDGTRHRVAFQVNQDDPAVMNLVLNNVANMAEYYRGKSECFQFEVVAYGPGLAMLRDDVSPVKDRIKQLVETLPPGSLRFSACNNTKEALEKREGCPIAIIPQAAVVPSGAVRLVELQEQGWSYLRP
jgi:intracellular sulfur oxidation DsrE/DsrF family protein